jgi:hypothetical protein
MQRHVSPFGDSISDDAFELSGERKHRAQDFADGGKIVVGNPATEAQQAIVKDGSGVDHVENILGGDLWFAIVEVDDDAHHPLLAKGDKDASSDYRRCAVRDTIGERHIERHRDGDVAEFGH